MDTSVEAAKQYAAECIIIMTVLYASSSIVCRRGPSHKFPSNNDKLWSKHAGASFTWQCLFCNTCWLPAEVTTVSPSYISYQIP